MASDEARKVRVITGAVAKGGTGKTTSTIHLAYRLKKKGRTVLFIDCDTQRNASSTLLDDVPEGPNASLLFDAKRGPETEVHEGGCGILVIPGDRMLTDIEGDPAKAGAIFRRNVLSVAQDYGVTDVVIDTPPTSGFGMVAPLIASDFMFSPIAPEPWCIEGVAFLLDLVTQVQQTANPKLRMLGFMVNKLDRKNARHGEALAVLEDQYEKHLIPHYVGVRASIANLAFTGEPVWNGSGGSAGQGAKEMRHALDWIINKMGDK